MPLTPAEQATPLTLPERLRQFRDERGFTRGGLAASLGVREITVFRWENGTARPSPLAAQKLAEMGLAALSQEDTNHVSTPRLAQRTGSRSKSDAARLETGATMELRIGAHSVSALPMSWVRNGPPDQMAFHQRLIHMQSEGLARFSPGVAARRLSMIERVEGIGTSAQFDLEEPRATAVAWNSNYGSHGWHRYVGRFPPHVVRSLLNHFGAGGDSVVCDPFVGSGTTAVECRLLGIPFVGVEICPLSVLMTRTKASFPASSADLRAEIPRFVSRYKEGWEAHLGNRPASDLSHGEVLRRTENVVHTFANVERWFTPEALLGVSLAVQHAYSLEGYARDAVETALSAKMRSIGNVDVDVVRAEYSKAPREGVDVGRLVATQLRKMADGIDRCGVTHEGLIGPEKTIRLKEGSALDVELPERSVTHIVTSPPYGVEAISYLRTHLLSYRSLAGELKHDPYDTREKTIGAEYVDANRPVAATRATRASATFREFFARPEADPKMEPRRLAMMQFFEDMYVVGERMAAWLVDGGQVAFIVGNKRLGERVIPTDSIIGEIFDRVELAPTGAIRHKLKTNNSNSQVPWQERVIQEESIMLFQRRPR